MKVRYTLLAASDLESALLYLTGHSPRAARRLQRRLTAIEMQIAQFPKSGLPTKLPWLRRCVLSPFPYLVFYEATKSEIVVHAIRHAARDPASMPDQSLL